MNSIISNYEPFTPSYDIQSLDEYENIDLSNQTKYKDLSSLFSDQRFISCNTPVVYYTNCDSGFGSQLTLFCQFVECIYKNNPNTICIPLFVENGSYFKYAEQNVKNSFFLYFKFKNEKELGKRVLDNKNIFVINFKSANALDCSEYYSPTVPLMSNSINNKQITEYRKNFKLKYDGNIRDYFSKIKSNNTPIIGIHLRSDAQKKMHIQNYLNEGSMLSRVDNLKNKLDNIYNNKYSVFLASDTNQYINHAKELFKNNDVYYIDTILRVNDESDSVPNINKSGYTLGYDILFDSLSLALCDEIYISPTNVMFIVACIADDPNIKMTFL